MSVRDFKGYPFESASYRTPEYVAFEKICRRELAAQCRKFGFKIHKFCPNHFEWSAVLEKDGQYVYVRMSDVRFWDWYNDILIRTMKHAEDWHGEENNRCAFNEIGKTADYILGLKLRRQAM